MSGCLNRPLAVTEIVKPQNLQIVYHFGVLHKKFSHRINYVTFITVDVGALVRESGAIFLHGGAKTLCAWGFRSDLCISHSKAVFQARQIAFTYSRY